MTSAGTTREVTVPELRVVAVSNDGTRLVLKAADSTEYTLPIDERLRAAIRGDRPRLGQIEIEVESHLRPRDIQARIRAGASAEEVAQAAGISVDRVRRFEGPVLAERAFMAERARKTAIRRHGESTGPQLGEAVSERLALRGAEKDTERWDSWRRDDGTWEVILYFRADGEGLTASWAYDPPRRLVQPNDDEARALIGESPEREEESVFPFIPRIARLPQDRPARPMIERPSPDRIMSGIERPSADRIMSGREVRESREAVAENRDSLTSLLDVVPAFRGDLAIPAVEAVPSEVVEEAEEQQAAPAASVGAGSAYADILMPRAVAPHRERLVGTTDRQAEADGVRPGRRATVPSWDEIVFGSRRKKQE
ncbi:septation protein SepH [Kitasatospora kazusensis]|uniref:septation protein SepH n=1 Tax=Kitasatospora kazusensis TaxID=407974 RepID=UPI0031E3B572